jgi:3-carboxy-cis,cis-muconate cycloisomerase
MGEAGRMQLLDPLFRWQALDEVFSDRARVQRMLDFEAALARAEARTGVIPTADAVAIEKKCAAERINFQQLAHAASLAGNLAIPLVKQLTALVAENDKQSSRFVHWGATSQDVIDTGFVLQLREALDLIYADLENHRAIPSHASRRTHLDATSVADDIRLQDCRLA